MPSTTGQKIRRALKWAGIGLAAVIVVVIGGVLILGLALHQTRPETGVTGERADELARTVEVATGQAAWQQLGAVEWDFGGRQQHLWDRARGYDRVRYGDCEVLLRVYDATGVADCGGQRLSGPEAQAALTTAQALFFNDSYWLNPFSKFFDPGVTRSLITTDDGEALFIEFAQGGSTPGDAYAIYLDDNGRPERWQMWVSIFPIGGVGATFDEWHDLGGGAMSAEAHSMGPMTLRLSGARAAPTVQELGDDPFGALQ